MIIFKIINQERGSETTIDYPNRGKGIVRSYMRM